ncbi:MAG: hypothetical protein KDJ75_08080 [Alphaproteobacteria bacterium]|nr:hypothetical protein [Alphaproteobacteria bacterium]
MAKPLNKIYTAATTGLIVALSGCAVEQQPNIYFSCTGDKDGALARAAHLFIDPKNGEIQANAATMKEASTGVTGKFSYAGKNYVSEGITHIDITFDPEDKKSSILAQGLAAHAVLRFCDEGETKELETLKKLESLGGVMSREVFKQLGDFLQNRKNQKRNTENQNRIQVNNTAVPSFVPDLGDPSI